MALNLPGTSAKIQKTTEGDEFKSEAEDRISSLPDAILCHVLSFLAIKSAAQTGILSKRWRDLWVSVPVLDFDMRPRVNFKGEMSTFDSFAKTQMKSFTSFVDRLLAVRGNLSIQKFRLSCDQIDPKCLRNWICAMRDVEELDLFVSEFREFPWSDFVGKSLKVMKLSVDILLNTPSALSFPSLKILHLKSVMYVDDQSVGNLLSCCPVLEDLEIERVEWDNVKNFVISVPSLRRLTLNFNIHEMYLYNSEDDENIQCNLIVDAPNVEYLRLLDYMSNCIIVNPMPYVTESHVSVSKIMESDDRTSEQIRNYGSNVCALFRSIQNVKYLTIGWFTMDSLSEAFDRRMPILHNLVHLEVDLDGVIGAIFLPTLLEFSPKLESLTLPRGITSPGLQGFSYEDNRSVSYIWKPPQNVPECFLFSLKVLEIRRITGEVEEELKLLKYILKNAMVLERMTILCEEWIVSGGPMDNFRERTSAARALVDRFPFRRDLMNYARGSAACQLDIQIPEPIFFP